MKNLLRNKELGVLAIIVLLSIVISFKSNVFLRPDNCIETLKNNSVLGIMALGMLLVIITGGIDVSVGAVVAAVTVIVGNFMVSHGANLPLVFLLAAVVGTLLGSVNGFFVAFLKIPPIVVTLGTMSVINGVILYYTDGNWINNIPQNFLDFGNLTFCNFIPDGSGGIIGIPVQIFFLLGALILTYVVLKYTVIGRGVYAIGGNLNSAQRVGYNIKMVQMFTYMYIGFLSGIAAMVHTSIVKQVDPNAFMGTELQVIAAVVLGGANILGGFGTVLGTFLGIVLLAVINNGLVLAYIPTYWQKIIIGAIILITVSFDIWQRQREEKRVARVDIE